MKMKFWILGYVCLLVSCSLIFGQAEPAMVTTIDLEPLDESRDRTVPLKVYLAESDLSKALPVILFSHGLGGSRNNNAYLGNYWAKQGYIVVFMQHIGSDESVWRGLPVKEIQAAMKQAVSVDSAVDRFKDVPFVIDQLEKWNGNIEHRLYQRFDLERIGMAGHSYGAVTAQAMMGQMFPTGKSAIESRIDAFIPMSPSCSKTMTPEQSFGKVKAPVLCMTGTKDFVRISPSATPESRQQVYQHLPAPDKYHLVFKDGEHSAFGQLSFGRGRGKKIAHHHPAILAISTLFWDAYLKDDATARTKLQSTQIRQDARLVEGDVWQWK